MNYKVNKILIILSILVSLIACSNEDNPIKITQSDVTFHESKIDSLTSYFSFSKDIVVSGTNYKLLLGNNEEYQSNVLMSFADIPEDIISVENAVLTIYTDLKPAGDMTISVKKLLQGYDEYEADWENSADGEPWYDTFYEATNISPITISDTIGIEQDSLVFEIPAEDILNWQHEDFDYYSLMLTTEDNNYMELLSSEHSDAPKLTFTYTVADEDDSFEYEHSPARDTYIVNNKLDDYKIEDNRLILNNLIPVRTYLKFDIDKSVFQYENEDNEIEELTDAELNHVTINEAYVRLYIKENSYFSSAQVLSAVAYRVDKEIDQAQYIDHENLEYFSNTGSSSTTISDDEESVPYFDVKITPLLQGFTSGEKENFGIVIVSAYESDTFNAFEFYGNESDEYKPQVFFKFTPPYLY